MLHKTNQQAHKKKMLLGLQLDMASKCRLVWVCGRGFPKALWHFILPPPVAISAFF